MSAGQKKEKPKFWGIRMYKRHIAMLRAAARKERVSQAQIVRQAIEKYVS